MPALAHCESNAASVPRAQVLASPLTRALLTAHLALPTAADRLGGAAPRPPPRLVAIPGAREHISDRVFGRDSVGTPTAALRARVARELGALRARALAVDAAADGSAGPAPPRRRFRRVVGRRRPAWHRPWWRRMISS